MNEKKEGLTPRQLEILISLDSRKDIVTICKEKSVSRTFIYKVIKGLFKKGLVNKNNKLKLKNYKLRRGYFLTKKGQNLLTRINVRPNKLTIKQFCEVCGFHLCVNLHHIDEDRSNNSKENLILLCPNHHYLIHYGGAKIENKNGFRYYTVPISNL